MNQNRHSNGQSTGAHHAARETDDQASGMGLTRLAIQRPWLLVTALAAVLIVGVLGYRRMGVELYPEVNFPVVMVTVVYPGAGPGVVESLVSRPLEDAVAGLPNLDRVETTSAEGLAMMAVWFTDKADPKTAAIDVEKRVNANRSNLPTDALAPTVAKFDFGALPIMNLTLSGDRPQEQLYDIANDRVRPKLEAVTGVGQVNVLGGRQREIQVKVDPNRLRSYGIALSQVSGALGTENVNLPGGQITGDTRNFNLRVDAKFRSLADVEETVVSAGVTGSAGGVVRVRDVAQVVDGFKSQTVLSRVNGKDAVSLSIQKESGANVTTTAAAVRKALTEINRALPQGVQLDTILDSSVFITNSLNGVQRSLVVAIVLTGLVLLVFLHAWRSTVIVLLAIPTSLVGTFAVMWLQGFTLNFLTTLALALTVGILVDDSIVVLENIYRHLSKGEAPPRAALMGRSEIGMAAIAITLVDVVVFTPVALMTGEIGQFFKQFGFTVVAATLFSLLISFTLTPLLASRWLRAEDEHGSGWLAAFGRRWERWFARLERGYARVLRGSLRVRWLVVAGAFLSLVAGIALPATGIVKTEFIPGQDNGYFFVQVETPPGSSLAASSAATAKIEEKLIALPEVESVFSSIGRGLDGSAGVDAVNVSVITVKMHEKRSRARTAQEVARQANDFGAGLPGVKVEASPDGVGGGTKPIQISIFGDDLVQLDAVAERVTSALTALGSVVNVRNTGQVGSPEYVISIDRRKAADLGLSAIQVASTVRTAYAGSVATQLRPDRTGTSGTSGAAVGNAVGNAVSNAYGSAAGIDVRVQLSDDVRHDLDKLASVPLISPTRGSQVLLGQIATISPATSLGQIQRRDKQRMITISAGLAEGKVLGEVSPQVESVLKQIEWPEGMRYSTGGETQQQADTFAEFSQAILLSIVLTYMLLVALYESAFYPLVVMLALPLALVGAMAGLAISRETLNLFSLIGVIMLTGLVGKNSILVVDFTNHLRKQGRSRLEALLEAGPARLRPILMTSAALIFAQIPLVLKLEEGAEIQAPLAVVVMGGMITSTFLALIFVPSMYTIVDDLQTLLARLARRIFTRKDETMTGTPGTTGGPGPTRSPKPAAAAAALAGTLVVGLVAFTACGPAEPAKAAPGQAPVSVAVSEVRRDTVRATYEGSGAVEAIDSIAVLPKAAGRIVALNAEVGQRVEPGYVIAEIDHYLLDTQVAQAEAGLAAAQARLAQLERGPRAEEIQIAAAQRDAAQAQVTAATLGLGTLDAQIKAAGETASAAQASAAAARSRVDALRNPRAEDVQLLQGQVNLAGIRLAQAASRDEELKLAAAQIDLARINLEQAQEGARPEMIRGAQSALDQAETALANLTQMPARAEDLAIARMSVEAAVAAYNATQASLGDAVKARNEAKEQADNLPFFLTRAQADLQLTQAEANLHQTEALLEQRRVQRDQAQLTYDKLAAGGTAWDVRQAQLRVEQAKAQLDLTRNPDPARVKSALLGVEQAQIGLDAKRKQIAFDLQSAEEGVRAAEAQLAKLVSPSPYDLQAVEEQAHAAEAQAAAARAQVEAIVAQKAGAEASTQAAAAGVRQAEAALALRRNPITPEDLRAARAAVQQAQAAVEAARAQRDEALVVAPVAGVIGSRSAAVGALAAPAAPLVTIVSDGVEITLPVEEARVGSIRAGQRVTLASPAYPGQRFDAVVVSLTPSADPRSRTFTARIRPDAGAAGAVGAAGGALRPGMSVQVSVNTDERTAVPVVSREALIQRDGRTSVYVVTTDGKAELRPIRLGLVAGPVAEIVEGLVPGDKVVIAGIEDLRTGQPVAIAAR